MSEPRVAVVAIHGVGDHQPFEMAKSVSALLEDLEDLDQGRRVPRYGAFMEHAIRINVAPVNIAGHGFESPATASLDQRKRTRHCAWRASGGPTRRSAWNGKRGPDPAPAFPKLKCTSTTCCGPTYPA